LYILNNTILELLSLYNKLIDISDEEDVYSAQSLPGLPNYRIAKDSHRNVAILITPASFTNDVYSPPIELRNLIYRPRCVCRICSRNEDIITETVSVLKCISDDPVLIEYFLRSLSGLIMSMPTSPTESEILHMVSKIIELFSAMESIPLRSIEGLWCELFLIAQAPQINRAIIAWHAEPNELYDFVDDLQRIEVKSTLGPLRIHNFNLDQITPVAGTDTIIVSFILEKQMTGLTIVDLWETINSHHDLSSNLRERVSRILTASLGNDWRTSRKVAFDPINAKKQLRLYKAEAIPKTETIPPEVSEVRFKSELTNIPSLSIASITEKGGLFKAVFD